MMTKTAVLKRRLPLDGGHPRMTLWQGAALRSDLIFFVGIRIARKLTSQ